MAEKWRVIPLGIYDAAMNMAIDHLLHEQVKQGGQPVIRFYQWQPGSVSIGKGNNSAIVNIDQCRDQSMQFVRRPTGGNAVYHAPKDLTYAVAAPTSLFPAKNKIGPNRTAYETICGWIIQAFSDIGIKAELVGKNDVVVNGKKVAGNAQLPQDALLQHGSLFISASPEEWSMYLRYPAEKLKGITNIASIIKPHSPEEFYSRVYHAFTHNAVVREYERKSLTKKEIEAAKIIVQEHYLEEHFFGTGTEKQGKACITDIQVD